jgi:hypothetical protein
VTLPLMLPAISTSMLFGFTLSLDEFQRSLLVIGAGQTLPLTIMGSVTTGVTPTLYALGTLTTLMSLSIVALYFGVLNLAAKLGIRFRANQSRRDGRERRGSTSARFGLALSVPMSTGMVQHTAQGCQGEKVGGLQGISNRAAAWGVFSAMDAQRSWRRCSSSRQQRRRPIRKGSHHIARTRFNVVHFVRLP